MPMDGLNLYWGDAHCQFRTARDPQFTRDGAPDWHAFIDQALRYAVGHVDVLPVIYYPAFDYRMPGGLVNESVGMQDGYIEEWDAIQQLSADHHAPGTLVT